jgi:hypothetical protein
MEDPIQVLGDGDLPKRDSIFINITPVYQVNKMKEMITFSVSYLYQINIPARTFSLFSFRTLFFNVGHQDRIKIRM